MAIVLVKKHRSKNPAEAEDPADDSEPKHEETAAEMRMPRSEMSEKTEITELADVLEKLVPTDSEPEETPAEMPKPAKDSGKHSAPTAQKNYPAQKHNSKKKRKK